MKTVSSLPAAVLVGRSNVGKSTLFNRLLEKAVALVLPESGTTRDRLEAEVSWNQATFTLIDTGGLDPTKTDIYKEAIKAGAFGGKLMGAGGGGFFFFIVPPEKQKEFKDKMYSIKVWVPFKFDTDGSQIVRTL